MGRALLKDEKEKRILSDLRMRRRPNKAPVPNLHGKERIARQIDRLEVEFEVQRKKAEVKRISRSKSRTFRFVARKLLQNPHDKLPTNYPPQRNLQTGLFFRVEGSKSRSLDSPYLSSSPSSSPIPTALSPIAPPTCPIPYSQIKDEIESQMIAISSNLKELHSAPTSPTRKLIRTKSNFDCDFAVSVRKLRKPVVEKLVKPVVSVTDETIKHLVGVITRKMSVKQTQGRNTPGLFQRFLIGKRAN